MRAVVQRVTRASVTVGGVVVGVVGGPGLLVLLGLTPHRGPAQVGPPAPKIA
ncbi:MAG: D-aminoacyl-tRNA deacylase, partial [Cellulomonas sp.]|nr:D-aminoacyl-tRNA deacylase [Cellulomonas sp.]